MRSHLAAVGVLFVTIIILVYLNFAPIAYMSRISLLKQSTNFPHKLEVAVASGGVIFLKTHKTASSTVSRILFRSLCEYYQCNCFLPNKKSAGRTWNLQLQADWDVIKHGIPYDAWLHHFVFSSRIFEVVPKAKILVSICRRPSQRFESAWYWYGHETRFRSNLTKFADLISHVYNYSRMSWISFALNAFYGFKYRTGLDATTTELLGIYSWKDMFSLKSRFQEFISSVSQLSTFLLVADRLDESLIILANVMGWDMHYILYKSHKVSNHTSNLNENHLSVLDRVQSYDFAIYQVANKVLDSLIHRYGEERFRGDLLKFRLGLKRLDEYCGYVQKSRSTTYLATCALNNRTCLSELAGVRMCESLHRDNREAIEHMHDELLAACVDDHSLAVTTQTESLETVKTESLEIVKTASPSHGSPADSTRAECGEGRSRATSVRHRSAQARLLDQLEQELLKSFLN